MGTDRAAAKFIIAQSIATLAVYDLASSDDEMDATLIENPSAKEDDTSDRETESESESKSESKARAKGKSKKEQEEEDEEEESEAEEDDDEPVTVPLKRKCGTKPKKSLPLHPSCIPRNPIHYVHSHLRARQEA
ncbi:hypothetical protein B0H13DRAFT_2303463 [Mycena leptocephala]|nr:hypothetical protein B0H13DRAFT_2303463 [Mycena leptocephala]